jgi:hypothetical protein
MTLAKNDLPILTRASTAGYFFGLKALLDYFIGASKLDILVKG